ncbi:MAG: hypothetical protein AAFQ87_02465, partial [Bacteroidota bacterium]
MFFRIASHSNDTALDKGNFLARLLCICLSLSFIPLSAQDQPSEGPINLSTIQAAIDRDRAPASKGTVFVRVKTDSLGTVVEQEILASTDQELALWVERSLIDLTWEPSSPQWHQLRFQFEPLTRQQLPPVFSLTERRFSPLVVALTQDGPFVPAPIIKPIFDPLDTKSLQTLGDFMLEPLSVAFLEHPEVSFVSVPELHIVYIPLETESIRPLKQTISSAALGHTIIEYTTVSVPQPEILFAYIPLETASLQRLDHTVSSAALGNTIIEHTTVLVPQPKIHLAYIPLETASLQRVNQTISSTALSKTSIEHTTVRLAVPEIRFAYLPLETDALQSITHAGLTAALIKPELPNKAAPPIAFQLSQPAYIPLETQNIARLASSLDAPMLLERSPKGHIVKPVSLKEWKPIYVPLDCEELQKITYSPSDEISLLTSQMPIILDELRVAVPEYRLRYIPIDCSELRALSAIAEDDFSGDYLLTSRLSHRAPNPEIQSRVWQEAEAEVPRRETDLMNVALGDPRLRKPTLPTLRLRPSLATEQLQ